MRLSNSRKRPIAHAAWASLVLLAATPNGASAQQTFSNFQAASLVVGQAGFTTAGSAVTASGLNGPSYTAISAQGRLAVANQAGGRVMIWNNFTTNGQAADLVLGQPNFTSSSTTLDASTITNCNGVAFSPDGNKLIASDHVRNRVLIWNSIPVSNGAPADVVLGQPNFTSSAIGSNTTGMQNPTGVYVSPDGRLLVSDFNNHRVLVWNTIPTVNGAPADVVIGQPNFTTISSGLTSQKLNSPWGLWVAPTGELLVADLFNSRVLIWNSIPTSNGVAANRVIGQPNFTSGSGGTTSSLMFYPIGVTVSPSGQVAISEFGNNRALLYNSIPLSNGAAANNVLGQSNFTSGSGFAPGGTPTSQNMLTGYNASFDLYGRLFVTGRDMNRVLVFGTLPAQTANLQLSISTSNDNACINSATSVTITVTNNGPNNATGVRVIASLPNGFTLGSATASGGSYTAAGGAWNIGTIPNGGSAVLNLNGTTGAAGQYTAAASIVASNQLDNNLANNAGSINYTIVSSFVFYADNDGDGFGNPLITTNACTAPIGFVTNNSDCDDTQVLYGDNDGDGFGAGVPVACGGVANNTDCDDTQVLYADNDGDGFGGGAPVACGGVANNSDCDDTQVLYGDNDGDGFGAGVPVACGGVANNTDCNDAQLNYADNDGDGFGAGPFIACGGVTNNSDCDDDLVTYADNDNDTFGAGAPTACGVANNIDCNDSDANLTFIGNGCDAGPGFVLGTVDAGCTCVGLACTTDLDLIYQSDNTGDLFWELRQQGTNILVQSGGGSLVGTGTQGTCLPDGCFYLVVTDDGGAGILGGGYILKINSAQRLIDNRYDEFARGGFVSGQTSQIAGSEGFCLPIGTDRLIGTSCDKMDWRTTCNSEYVVANGNALVTAQYGVTNSTSGYQMWWYNPNSGYSFKRIQYHSTTNGLAASATRACHFRINAWSGNQLQDSDFYNVKVRGIVNNVPQNWGPACRFMINNAEANCPRTKLNDGTTAQFLSCNQTKAIASNVYVYANPVRRLQPNCTAYLNANRYQFRFRIVSESFELIKTSATGQYLVNTIGLACGKTYEVDVRASFDNGATWCHTGSLWGDVCTMSTPNCLQGGGNQSMILNEAGQSELRGTQQEGLSLYPNPNAGNELFVNLTGIDASVETVSVDIYDAFGKRASARTIAVNGQGFMNTIMQLNGELAAGLYTVSFTAGEQQFTERLVVQP